MTPLILGDQKIKKRRTHNLIFFFFDKVKKIPKEMRKFNELANI